MNRNFNSSKASCSKTSEGQFPAGRARTVKDSSIQSLADDVAMAAITTAENALKGSAKNKTVIKKEKSSKDKETQKPHCEAKGSAQNSLSQNTEARSGTMIQKEEKLDSLCKLLERLETTYGTQNGPSKSPIKVNSLNTGTSTERSGSSSKKILPEAQSVVNDQIKKDKSMSQRDMSSPKKEKQSSPKKDKQAFSQKNNQASPQKGNKNLPQKEKQALPQHEKQAIPQHKHALPQHEKQALPQNEKQALPQNEKQALLPDENQTLSQEEKQALRKAKKEEKKSVKQSTQKPEKQQLNASTNNEVEQVKQTSIQQISASEAQISENKTEKSKADLKRERREKQEAQRAAKEAKTKALLQKQEESKEKKAETSQQKSIKTVVSKKQNISDRHIPLLEHLTTLRTNKHNKHVNCDSIHPAVRTAGLCMKEKTIDGCIARVVATLSAIYNLVEDYSTPSSHDLSRDLSTRLQTNIDFLNSCRQVSEPMNNAIRFVKCEINKVGSSVAEKEAKENICKAIDTYVNQNIVLASETIIQNALHFIENEDVLLTYGFSNLVYETIEAAAKDKEKFSVIVVDNPAVPSGVNLLQRLVHLGIDVYYRILPDLPHIINKVTKVLVDADAVVLNGAVIGPCGMAGLILLASKHSVPVIVLSHTFKFCNIDLTDSLVVNELGESSAIVNCASSSYNNLLAEWKENPSLNVVNLMYDVTPSSLINVLVTERNNFPTSVVPVIIKRNYADILGHD